MEHSQEGSSSFSSLPHLFDQLEIILEKEYQHRNTPWMPITKVKEIAVQKYDIDLDIVAQKQGFGNNLKSLLSRSRRFAIYSTPALQEFYVARLQDIVPNHQQDDGKPVQYRIKRPWKVDRRLITMLANEGEIRMSSSPSPSRSAHQPKLPPRLLSIDDLELALTVILKCLTSGHPENVTTIGALSKIFYDHYRHPIRTAVRSLCPDMVLLDVLERMPHLDVQEEEDGEIMIYYIEV